jgi:hypothetical protein
MTAKFSHLSVDQHDLGSHVLTLCGRRVNVMSIHWVPKSAYIKVAPLCPKCAAAKLIAETAGVAN